MRRIMGTLCQRAEAAMRAWPLAKEIPPVITIRPLDWPWPDDDGMEEMDLVEIMRTMGVEP
jgi:hypothetical protein